jgi:carbonic anhydrase
MEKLKALFEHNREWAKQVAAEDPNYFPNLAAQQKPEYLWIGCADSRVPANVITGLAPGEIFVHRNVANIVDHTDFNCLSVVQYAVEVLEVKHIIVCGHYGCGGVGAALSNKPLGLIDNWIRNIKDVHHRHLAEMSMIDNPERKLDRLCELNVTGQVANVCYTTIVQDAWARGQDLTIHGWIYGLSDGLLQDLSLCISAMEQLPEIYRMA